MVNPSIRLGAYILPSTPYSMTEHSQEPKKEVAMKAKVIEVQVDTEIVIVSNEQGEYHRISKTEFDLLNLRFTGSYGRNWRLIDCGNIRYFDFQDDIWRIERR